MKTYRQLSVEQYPIPQGVLTKKQTEYYKRIQAIQICAFRDGAKAILRIIDETLSDGHGIDTLKDVIKQISG
ncbi:MAG: hypothetical protein J6N70_10535 [Oribacterium sp.]|nr:hypothetical protein [Oribacterium sp.]